MSRKSWQDVKDEAPGDACSGRQRRPGRRTSVSDRRSRPPAARGCRSFLERAAGGEDGFDPISHRALQEAGGVELDARHALFRRSCSGRSLRHVHLACSPLESITRLATDMLDSTPYSTIVSDRLLNREGICRASGGAPRGGSTWNPSTPHRPGGRP